MKKTVLFILLALLFVMVFLFFGRMAMKAVNNETPATESVQTATGDNGASYAEGARIYQEKCVVCHQANGMGIPGTFPPLKGSDFLKTVSKKRVIQQVMNGSNGSLTVNGVHYTTPMPPQVNNAQEAVEVTNYILNAWGNHYGMATLQDAKGVKKSNKKGRHGMMNRGMMGRGGC